MICFHLPERSRVVLAVYDVSGREVRRLVDGELGAGSHTADWRGLDGEGREVGSGVYFYNLRAGGMEITRKMVLIR